MKAFGYIRCSGLGQLSGDGPDRQREAIQTFADRNNIQIAEWYVESHTGTDLEGRPKFREMREALVSNGVRLVIVERLERLARDVMIQETIIADFRKHDIDLKSATAGEEDLCSTEPTRELVRVILGAIAKYDRCMILRKLNSARDRKRANGERMEGRLPYGSKPGEDVILKMMLAWKKTGCNASQMAAWLNAQSQTTRYGKQWHAATVSKILARHVD